MDAAPDASEPKVFAAGTRCRDLLLFFSVLGMMLLLSPRLRVYDHVTVADVSVERVTRDGHSVALPTPAAFIRPGNGSWAGDVLVARLEPRIDDFMRDSAWNRDAEPGTRFIWTIRWSDDSPRLDHLASVTWEVPSGAPAR